MICAAVMLDIAVWCGVLWCVVWATPSKVWNTDTLNLVQSGGTTTTPRTWYGLWDDHAAPSLLLLLWRTTICRPQEGDTDILRLVNLIY